MLPISPHFYVYHGFGCCLFACFLPFLFFHVGKHSQTTSNSLRGWSISTDLTLEIFYCRTAVCNSSTLPTGCQRTPCLFLLTSVITQSVGLFFSQVFCHVSYSSSLISQHCLQITQKLRFPSWNGILVHFAYETVPLHIFNNHCYCVAFERISH